MGDILVFISGCAMAVLGAMCAFLEAVLWFGLNPRQWPSWKTVGFFFQCVGVSMLSSGVALSALRHILAR